MDKFSKHEALDRTCLIMEIFNTYVLEHEVVESDPELKKKAELLSESLYQFYNLLGENSKNKGEDVT